VITEHAEFEEISGSLSLVSEVRVIIKITV